LETFELRVEADPDVKGVVALLPERQADGNVVFVEGQPIAQQDGNVFRGDLFASSIEQAQMMADPKIGVVLFMATTDGRRRQQTVIASPEGRDRVGYGD
jgi:hypothetical protein